MLATLAYDHSLSNKKKTKKSSYSNLKASIGLSLAAFQAGTLPKMTPTPIANKHAIPATSWLKSTGTEKRYKICTIHQLAPRASTPPKREISIESIRNWETICQLCAPIALRIPISRVLSVTDTSIIFITPIHHTSNDIAPIPIRIKRACLANCSCSSWNWDIFLIARLTCETWRYPNLDKIAYRRYCWTTSKGRESSSKIVIDSTSGLPVTKRTKSLQTIYIIGWSHGCGLRDGPNTHHTRNKRCPAITVFPTNSTPWARRILAVVCGEGGRSYMLWSLRNTCLTNAWLTMTVGIVPETESWGNDPYTITSSFSKKCQEKIPRTLTAISRPSWWTVIDAVWEGRIETIPGTCSRKNIMSSSSNLNDWRIVLLSHSALQSGQISSFFAAKTSIYCLISASAPFPIARKTVIDTIPITMQNTQSWSQFVTPDTSPSISKKKTHQYQKSHRLLHNKKTKKTSCWLSSRHGSWYNGGNRLQRLDHG